MLVFLLIKHKLISIHNNHPWNQLDCTRRHTAGVVLFRLDFWSAKD